MGLLGLEIISDLNWGRGWVCWQHLLHLRFNDGHLQTGGVKILVNEYVKNIQEGFEQPG